MTGVIRSELVRLGRVRLLAGWFGLTALFAVMVNSIMFSTASEGGGPEVAPGAVFPDLATLTSGDGLVAGLGAASSMFGLVTLSFWAVAVATDYSSGLIRLLVSAKPHRWQLLLGKTAALLAVTAVATTVATVVNVGVALPAAEAAGVSTDAWSTGAPATLAGGWLNAFAAQVVWGVLGLTLAVVTRSSAVAISIGAGYVLVVESIVRMSLDDVDWLLGSTLTALASGGDAVLSYAAAAGAGAVYVAAGLLVATLVFTRRDVTD